MAAATATATAPWIKPKFASMFKTTSEALTAAAGTPNAINAFLAYVNAKKKAAGKPEDATHDNIVDELIEVMNAKQLFSGKINLTGNVLPLYQIMFGTTITRTQIFSHIKNVQFSFYLQCHSHKSRGSKDNHFITKPKLVSYN